MPRTRPIAERFWEKVSRAGHDACWLWTGTLSPGGYGLLHHNRKHALAHRVAWEIAHGPIPAGRHVWHTCESRACVNPAHLFLGGHSESNMGWRWRGAAGERVARHILTAADVLTVRARYAAGEAQKNLASDFRVHQSQISRVVNRKSWNHVEEP